MSNVNQIYTIVNEAKAQSIGEKAVSVVDTSTLIALGDEVLSSDKNTDAFLNALVDRIGKTVFSVRRYVRNDAGMIREPFEFGCVVQKIYVDLPDAKQNNSWEIGKETYKPDFAPIIKPSVKQKLFNKIATWEINVTIPDTILKTAFTSASAMATLIDAIFTSMDNMMQIALENNANLTRASFIARKFNKESRCGAINLLKEYNTLTNAELTVSSALRNTEFLKWATMQINLWTKRMGNMSTLFNDEGYKRHTSMDNMVVNVLQDFASATSTFLQSDTYNKELVALPLYKEVPFWQGSGESYAFEDTSKIDIKLDAERTVTKTGIVAVAYDYEAMGVTMNDRRSTSERNNHDEYTNYYNKASIGYFNDMSENGIVFYMAEA